MAFGSAGERIFTENCLSNLPQFTFPAWVPPAVIAAGKELNDVLAKERDPVKAFGMLSRLVSDPLMERVWQVVFKKKRVLYKPTQEYLNPAFTYASRVAAFRQKASDLRGKGGEVSEHEAESWETEATSLEAEAKVMEGEFDPLSHPQWTRQDRAAQILLQHAYRIALDDEPVFQSSLIDKTNALRKATEDLRAVADTLKRHQLEREVRQLVALAEDIEDEAQNTDPLIDPRTGEQLASSRFPHVDDPWVLVRETSDVRMRSFVISLSITTVQLFGNALYSTLANITNVVFERNDVTDSRVREILRIRPEDAD
jgi:hypothetical protein